MMSARFMTSLLVEGRPLGRGQRVERAPTRRSHAGTAVLRSLTVERDRRPVRYTSVRDVRVPTFLYGTAWKEDETARLVRMAPDAGFRAIDTANQLRHYHESGVREGERAADAPRC